ncbi:hypothetical protein QR680_014754 [Steinernema hermaphroditum]|uniref:Uncharacterized protein n=1 Tax=Steinernema hermaphroditum TaxID=289476 RepID=A0AA39M3R8_9BILA|nr:hypothetical protein QR680_014754 [Steinernema hermaphroditum]
MPLVANVNLWIVAIVSDKVITNRFSSHDLQGFVRRYGRALRPQEPAIGFDGGHFHHGPICGQERHREVIPHHNYEKSKLPPFIADLFHKEAKWKKETQRKEQKLMRFRRRTRD